MKKFALIVIILLFAFCPAHSLEYDPLNTITALNMAIVSINRILTTQSRAVLEQEYNNIINNLSIGNIESDKEITDLFTNLMSIITRKRVREEDSRRLRSYYDSIEQRRITYALSNIGLTEGAKQRNKKLAL